MTCFLFTFLLTTAFWLTLLGYGLRRVLNHMKNNPEAQAAITQHVLSPLLSREDKPAA